MFRNQIAILFRQLWKHKLYTFLHIIGLSIGIAAAWIIFRLVVFENSYDKQIVEADKIYQLYTKNISEGREGSFGGVSRGVYPILKNQMTGIEHIVPLYYQQFRSLFIQNQQGVQKKYKPSSEMVSTVPAVFDLLKYEFIAGDAETSLDAPHKIVLTESRANIYFPNETPHNIIGKTLIFEDSIPKQISGIVKDLKHLNSFQINEFILINEEANTATDWSSMNSNDLLYIKVNNGFDKNTLLKNLNAINLEKNKPYFEKYGYKTWIELLPLTEKHFFTEIGNRTRTADKTIMKGLIAVSIFLLLLGCINYINLSTAQIPQKSKAIGIRKTLGSSSKDIITSFLKETFIIIFLASLLAFGLSGIFIKLLSEYLPSNFSQFIDYGSFILFMLILIVILSVLSGIYPAWLTTKLNTVSILKGQLSKNAHPKKINLRKSLIVFQFIVAQFFIICTLVIAQQMKYTLNKDLGFNKDAIISFDLPYEANYNPAYANKQFVLKDQILKNANIEGVTLGDLPMSNDMWGNILNVMNDTGVVNGQFNLKHVDDQTFSVFNMELVAGRNIHFIDSITEYIINETAVEKYGLGSAQNAIGKIISNDVGKSGPIVGVVKDFHHFGMKDKIDPILMIYNKSSLQSVNVKLPMVKRAEWPDIIKNIESEWKKIYTDSEFSYRFYDDIIGEMYTNERKTSKLIQLATFITLLISCLGLFGLSTITIFQRTKEIGIRKVLGASIPEIITLLSKEIVVLILISILIASPLAWYMMQKWLENYVFRIDINIWIFMLGGILTIFFAWITIGFQSFKAAQSNPVNSLRNE